MKKVFFIFVSLMFLSLMSVDAQNVRFSPTHMLQNGQVIPNDDPRDCYVEVKGNECKAWVIQGNEYKFDAAYREIPNDGNGYRVFQFITSYGVTKYIHIYNDFSMMYTVGIYANGQNIMRYFKKRDN